MNNVVNDTASTSDTQPPWTQDQLLPTYQQQPLPEEETSRLDDSPPPYSAENVHYNDRQPDPSSTSPPCPSSSRDQGSHGKNKAGKGFHGKWKGFKSSWKDELEKEKAKKEQDDREFQLRYQQRRDQVDQEVRDRGGNPEQQRVLSRLPGSGLTWLLAFSS